MDELSPTVFYQSRNNKNPRLATANVPNQTTNLPRRLNQLFTITRAGTKRTQSVTLATVIRRFDNRFALEGSLLEQVTPVCPRHD